MSRRRKQMTLYDLKQEVETILDKKFPEVYMIVREDYDGYSKKFVWKFLGVAKGKKAAEEEVRKLGREQFKYLEVRWYGKKCVAWQSLEASREASCKTDLGRIMAMPVSELTHLIEFPRHS